MSLDIATSIAIYSAVQAGKVDSNSLLGRFIGPTVDYMGKGLANFAEKSSKNLSRILEHALDIYLSKPDNGGAVNPRVLKHIINEGSFCEDDLTRAYFGGVLASSRNSDSADDRGLNFVSLLNSMSSYQIRAHYIFYTTLRKRCAGADISFSDNHWIQKTQVFIPYIEFLDLMNLKLDISQQGIFFPHIFSGLGRLGLISSYSYGDLDHVKKYFQKANCPGITIVPSDFGIELYMCMNGHSDIPQFRYLDKNIEFIHSDLLSVPPGAEILGL